MTFIKVDAQTGTTAISYTGPGDADADAASVRTVESIPRDCPLYYFEVEVLDRGDSGCIGVGLMEADVYLHRLPGWEPRSYGYHGDDGNIFHGEGRAQPYGHTYTTGDVVGVCVDCVQRTVAFFKNGMCRGIAFRGVRTASLHPCVGFRSRGARVRVNLGAEPFRHGVSLESLRHDASAVVTDEIAHAVIPPCLGSNASPVSLAILDHLIHTSCWKTAAMVVRDLLGPHSGGTDTALLSEADIHHMCVRQSLRRLIENGKIAPAKDMIEEACPGLLSSRPDLNFTLELQCFVELLRTAATAAEQSAALAFAQRTLSTIELGSSQKERLKEAIALLAYDDPHTSPSAFLFGQDKRSACAAEVNGAIMQHHGREANSALEALLCQLKTVHEELVASGVVAAQLVNIKDLVTGFHKPSCICPTPSSDADGGLAAMQE